LATELNPLDGRFPYRLGTIFDSMARLGLSLDQQGSALKEATDAYHQAIRIDPYSPLNYMGLANIALSQGRRNEARSWLQQAVAYEPNYLPAHLRLAELSLSDGNVTDARSEFETIVAVQKRYQRGAMNDLEHQFLDVNPSALQNSLSIKLEQ